MAPSSVSPSLHAYGIYRIGIVSDTHGRLPQDVTDIFSGNYREERVYERVVFKRRKDPENEGLLPRKELQTLLERDPKAACDLIIHAGDIVAQSTIDELEAYAPVIAVKGNCDWQDLFTQRGWTRDYEAFTFHGVDIAVLHKPSDLRSALTGSPWQAPFIKSAALRIHGHTHEPHITPKESFVTVCPGSPTRPREGTRRSVAIASVQEGHVRAVELIALAGHGSATTGEKR